MVCFQTKNPNLGKFLRALEWKIHTYIFLVILEYFKVIWYILRPFGNVVVIWYIFPRFGILCQEKSGNPDPWSKISSTFPFGSRRCSVMDDFYRTTIKTFFLKKNILWSNLHFVVICGFENGNKYWIQRKKAF
jgi:hypothetical protein